MPMQIADIKARVEIGKEQRRQIERQKMMLDDDKFVLAHEFFEHAVAPISEVQEVFTAVYNYRGARIETHICGLKALGDIEVGHLPFSDLPEDTVDAAESYLQNRARQIMHYKTVDVMRAFIGVRSAHWAETAPYKDLDEGGTYQALKDLGLPGISLRDLKFALDVKPSFLWSSRATEYEITSLVRGEGDLAAKFWGSVNNLKDRSGLFPDQTTPKGGETDRGGGGSYCGWDLETRFLNAKTGPATT